MNFQAVMVSVALFIGSRRSLSASSSSSLHIKQLHSSYIFSMMSSTNHLKDSTIVFFELLKLSSYFLEDLLLTLQCLLKNAICTQFVLIVSSFLNHYYCVMVRLLSYLVICLNYSFYY